MQKPFGGFSDVDFWGILQSQNEFREAFLNVLVFKSFLYRYACELCEAGHISTTHENILQLISALYLCHDNNVRTPKTLARLLVNFSVGVINFKPVNPNSILLTMRLNDLIEPNLSPAEQSGSSWFGSTIKIVSRNNSIEVKWEVLFHRVYLCFLNPEYCGKIQILANKDIAKPVRVLKDFENLDFQLGDLIILHLVHTAPVITEPLRNPSTYRYEVPNYMSNLAQEQSTHHPFPLDRRKCQPKSDTSLQFTWHVNTMNTNPSSASTEDIEEKKTDNEK